MNAKFSHQIPRGHQHYLAYDCSADQGTQRNKNCRLCRKAETLQEKSDEDRKDIDDVHGWRREKLGCRTVWGDGGLISSEA